MSVSLPQLSLESQLARIATNPVSWIKSAGTWVLANEDNPLPVTIVTGVAGEVDIVTVNAVASSTTNIPVGATSVGYVLLTGTGTVNAVPMVLGLPENFIGPIKTATPIVLGVTSTARISYTV